MDAPSIAVAVPAYNASAWIVETLESVVGQTSPPDEVVVVDDGSTDDTFERASSVDPAIRVIRQENRGAPGAYNRGFREASSEFVAMCPADDVWQPRKLEWQRETLGANRDIDITFGHAELFGRVSGPFPHPDGTGKLEPARFLAAMYDSCLIAAPTAVVRRRLHEQLGGFNEDISIEDYEFWLRALTSNAAFYFDPRLLVRLRQHDSNLGTSNALLVWELNLWIHRRYEDSVQDKQLVRRVIARDLATIGRCQLGRGNAEAARASYRDSLRQRSSLSALGAALLLHLPGARRSVGWLRSDESGNDSVAAKNAG